MAFETGLSEDSYEVVVIGGGLAGLATAASPVSSGVTSVLVLESEAIHGLTPVEEMRVWCVRPQRILDDPALCSRSGADPTLVGG